MEKDIKNSDKSIILSKVFDNKAFFSDITQLIKEGRQVKVKVGGVSMLPFIKGNRDLVVLERVDNVSIGDILLCKISDHYVIHRLIARNGDHLVLMGDGNCYGTEQCSIEDVSGKVITIIRPNGKHINCNSKRELRKARLWHSLVFIRRYLLFFYKKFIYVV